METQRQDVMIKDEKAVELTKRLNSERPIYYNSDWFKQTPMSEANKILRIMPSRQMGRYAQDFLHSQPDATVIHVGCGLDTCFERVDNGHVELYNLDLPKTL